MSHNVDQSRCLSYMYVYYSFTNGTKRQQNFYPPNVQGAHYREKSGGKGNFVKKIPYREKSGIWKVPCCKVNDPRGAEEAGVQMAARPVSDFLSCSNYYEQKDVISR